MQHAKNTQKAEQKKYKKHQKTLKKKHQKTRKKHAKNACFFIVFCTKPTVFFQVQAFVVKQISI